MKRQIQIRLIIAALASQCACGAIAVTAPAYTNFWTVNMPDNPPVVLDVWRGETIGLCARTGLKNAPAPASFLWQTPDMGSSWHVTNAAISADGDVSAIWSPTMDSGAETYFYFMRIGDSIYRPRGTIRMRGSPGAVPDEMPIPPRVIDFAAVSATNAPWITAESDPLALPAAQAAQSAASAAAQSAGAWQGAHLAAANPHGVTAAQTGALTALWAATGTVGVALSLQGAGAELVVTPDAVLHIAPVAVTNTVVEPVPAFRVVADDPAYAYAAGAYHIDSYTANGISVTNSAGMQAAISIISFYFNIGELWLLDSAEGSMLRYGEPVGVRVADFAVCMRLAPTGQTGFPSAVAQWNGIPGLPIIFMAAEGIGLSCDSTLELPMLYNPRYPYETWQLDSGRGFFEAGAFQPAPGASGSWTVSPCQAAVTNIAVMSCIATNTVWSR